MTSHTPMNKYECERCNSLYHSITLCPKLAAQKEKNDIRAAQSIAQLPGAPTKGTS